MKPADADLDDLAFKDLHSGNLEHAKTLAGQALSRNPSDLVARAILDDIAKRANGAPALAAGPAAPAAKPADSKPVVGRTGRPESAGRQSRTTADFLRPKALPPQRRSTRAPLWKQQWQKDVQSTINQARSQVDATPDAAAALIHNKTNDLKAETALGPEMRDRLLGMLRTASREIQPHEENTAREQQRIRERWHSAK